MTTIRKDGHTFTISQLAGDPPTWEIKQTAPDGRSRKATGFVRWEYALDATLNWAACEAAPGFFTNWRKPKPDAA